MSERTEIDVHELWRRLQGGRAEPFFLLDVRNPEEIARWRPEGTARLPVVEVPYFDFIDDEAAALARVPTDLGEAVVLCAKGGSSEYVADLLRSSGRAAVNVAGGMVAWGDLHVPIRVDVGEALEGRAELWQLNRYGKGCLSYALISGGEAAIVDPSRFPELYERFVADRGARIVEVLETHVHADHLSGGHALARRTGARYRLLDSTGRSSALGGDVLPLPEDGRLVIGGAGGVVLVARALRTPGHTPDSVSYLLGERVLLSGDTLFVQGVGRPDLGGKVEEWGRALHQTLREVIAPLPGDTVVLPAHFAGAAEAGRGGLVSGRLDELRRRVPELHIDGPDQFVARIKEGVGTPPAIYAQIVQANLGLVNPGDQAGEWELGKNECAASAGRAA